MTPSLDNSMPPGLEAMASEFGIKVKGNGNIPEPEQPLDSPVDMPSSTSSPADTEVVPAVPEVVSTKAKYGPVAEKGGLPIVHNLYQSPPDEHEVWTWVEDYPKNVSEAAENEESAKCALILRNVKSTDGRRKMEAHSLVIQSPQLKKALAEVLEDYPGITCSLQRLEFAKPFEPFVHRWAAFLKYRAREDLDATTKEHIELLYTTLLAEVGEKIQEFEDYVLNGVITFESLWMIFQPGSLIISTHKGISLSAFELQRTFYAEDQCGKFLSISCDSIGFDGKNFGRETDYISIRAFTGTKKINTLHAFPLHFWERKDSLKAKLMERGKRYEELAGYQFKA
jgi:hypothetical protein